MFLCIPIFIFGAKKKQLPAQFLFQASRMKGFSNYHCTMKIKIGLLIVYLIPFFVISLFNQPAIDDYWNANAVISHGKLGSVLFFYKTISGRYFSIFLMSLFNTLVNGGTWIFKIWPVVTLLLLILSQYFLYKSIFQNKLSNNKLLFAALIFVAIPRYRTSNEGVVAASLWLVAYNGLNAKKGLLCFFTVANPQATRLR